MSWPINYSTSHLTGQYLGMTAQPMTGSITFIPAPETIIDPDTQEVFIPTPIVVVLDSSGSFAVDLPATDDEDINPTNWTYSVNENLEQDGTRYSKSYSINAPAGANIDISSLIPVSNNLGDPIVRGPSGPQGPAGDAGGIASAAGLAIVFGA